MNIDKMNKLLDSAGNELERVICVDELTSGGRHGYYCISSKPWDSEAYWSVMDDIEEAMLNEGENPEEARLELEHKGGSYGDYSFTPAKQVVKHLRDDIDSCKTLDDVEYIQRHYSNAIGALSKYSNAIEELSDYIDELLEA